MLGDKRFSAHIAMLKNGKSVQKQYTEDKIKAGVKDQIWIHRLYMDVWILWANENPELIKELKDLAKGKHLTNRFEVNANNPATALSKIIEEPKEEEDLRRRL